MILRRSKSNAEHDAGDIVTRLADTGGKTPLETYKAPSRANTRPLTTHQDEAAIKALKRISAETGRTMQSLLASGINHVLAQHGQPPLADETPRR